MTKKQSTKKGGTKGKAEGGKGEQSAAQQRATDELTAERIRNILSAPGARGKKELRGLCIDLFGEHGGGCVEETPDYIVLLFEAGASGLRSDEEEGRPAPGRPAFEQIVALTEKHEPKEYKLARRVSEIYAEAKRRGDREDFIMQAADEVTTSGGEGVMLQSPASEFFVPFFAKAVRDLSPKYRALVEITSIVSRYDAGVTLREMAEEEKARGREREKQYKADKLAKPEPKKKLSDEWRHWKLRQIEHAFSDERMKPEGREPYNAAHDYFRGLLTGLFVDEGFYRGDFILRLLPELISIRQELDEIDRYERRMRAGMKGAQTRKARASQRAAQK